MTQNAFMSILDQIAPYTDHLYFHVKGEPLLHPDIGSFLDLCHVKGLKVNITTNGTLIQDLADTLLSKPALRQVNFSLHSFYGNEQSVTNEDYLGRIFSFIHRSVSRTDTKISLRLWNHVQDGGETISDQKNQNILAQIEKEFNLPYKIVGNNKTAQGIKIADKVFLSLESEFTWPSLSQEDDSARGFCYALKTQAAILVDGTVVPCCLDADGIMKLGSIHEAPFSEIIDSERAKKINEGFQKREAVETLCRKCSYKKRFG